MPAMDLRMYEGGVISRPHFYTNIFGEQVILVPDPVSGVSLPFWSIRNLEDLQSYLEEGGKLYGLGAYLNEIGIESAIPRLSHFFNSDFTIPAGIRIFRKSGDRGYLHIQGEEPGSFVCTYYRESSSLIASFGLSHCEICDHWVPVDRIFRVTNGHNCYCVSCESRVTECAGCSTYSRRDYFRMITDVGARCRDCADNYHHCDHCDEYHESRSCPNADLDDIQDHGFAPAIIKFGDLPASKFPFYIGMELELCTEDPVGTLRHARQKHGDLFWGVYDGSVDGVELVSHPATLEYWQNFNLSVPSYVKNGNAGIHLHACRSGFNHSQMENILKLFAQNTGFVKHIAERDEKMDQWARITPIRELEEISDFQKFIGWDKYSAVNFLHKHTFEFRIFNSSKRNPTILKNIEFIGSLWEWSKGGSVSGSPTLSSYLDYAGKSDLSHLKSFLTAERLIPA